MFHIDKAEIQAQLLARGINPEHIRALHVKLQSGELDRSSFVIEASRLRVPKASDVVQLPDHDDTTMRQIGIEALQHDELALLWLNGGAATRYFDRSKVTTSEQTEYGIVLDAISKQFSNSPKGITPVVNNRSYLELKIRNLLQVTKQHKLEAHPHVILMNSFVTDNQTRQHLTELFSHYPDLDPSRFHFVVQQPIYPRFTKVKDMKDIDLFVNTTGELSWAPCGHGDFVYLVQDYFKTIRLPKLRYLCFTNVDNLAAGIDPTLLGMHIQSKKGRTVELVKKEVGDKGGEPCFVDDQLVIMEQMKFPEQFDHSQIPWFNTNTFWFTLSDLLQFNSDLPLVLAEKTIQDNEVIQLERFACDVNVPSQYVVVPREQRFWPVKRYVDLLHYQSTEQFKTLLKELYNL